MNDSINTSGVSYTGVTGDWFPTPLNPNPYPQPYDSFPVTPQPFVPFPQTPYYVPPATPAVPQFPLPTRDEFNTLLKQLAALEGRVAELERRNADDDATLASEVAA